MRTITTFAFGLAASLSMVACSTPATIDPQLSLKSPDNNATIADPADHKIPVEFSTNYLLKPTGQCNSQNHCGAVYLLVDNTTCNAAGVEYNAFAVTSPTSVDLSLCPTELGTHKITAELHDDDGTLVDDNITKDPVTSSVTITVQ